MQVLECRVQGSGLRDESVGRSRPLKHSSLILHQTLKAGTQPRNLTPQNSESCFLTSTPQPHTPTPKTRLTHPHNLILVFGSCFSTRRGLNHEPRPLIPEPCTLPRRSCFLESRGPRTLDARTLFLRNGGAFERRGL